MNTNTFHSLSFIQHDQLTNTSLHEQQDIEEQGGQDSRKHGPHGERIIARGNWGNKPATSLGFGYLQIN